jgi:very-short-patch-repair endonuclease
MEHHIRRFGQGACSICGTLYWKRKEEQTTCSKVCSGKLKMQDPWVKSQITSGGIRALQRHRDQHGVWNKGVPWSEDVRVKMSESHKKANHDHLNGGNGTGGSRAENLLRTVLPDHFVQEYVFKMPYRPPGYPTHYKLDFADPVRKLAIEVQGQSHITVSVRQKDLKKRTFLEKFGWTVLYVTNEEVMSMFGISASKKRKPISQVAS